MRPRFEWTEEEVRRALDLGSADGSGYRFSQVSTDSRSLGRGALFVALRGPRFDGHRFVQDAVERGAGGVVVEEGTDVSAGEAPTFRVPDTLVALGRLARHRRRRAGWTVVGVTGSVGKTTAKELLGGALATRFQVHATEGNRNNRVGLPLTLLEAPLDCDLVVAEMGTNAPGEIELLVEVAEPEVGVLTTVGEAHMEGLRSLDGVFREKLALLAGLPPEGWAVVGDDPTDLPERARAVLPRVAVAGISERADPEYRARDVVVEGDGTCRFQWKDLRVRMQVPGWAGVKNAALALATADRLGVEARDAVAAVEGVEAPALRGERRSIGGLTVLLDCYNANPPSVRAALTLLAHLPNADGRVAVLGSMLELGEGAAEWHRVILQEALRLPFTLVVLVGDEFRAAWEDMEDEVAVGAGPEVVAVSGARDALPVLRRGLKGGEAVLLKGSRGMALEELVPLLEAEYGAAVPPRSAGEE